MPDYCAGCGERLKEAPLGGRYYCCSSMYWSHAKPLDEDVRGLRQIRGESVKVQSEWYDWRANSDRYGLRTSHEPLYLYGR